jgi:hypothetical protein
MGGISTRRRKWSDNHREQRFRIKHNVQR